jgi:hypothetical protein
MRNAFLLLVLGTVVAAELQGCATVRSWTGRDRDRAPAVSLEEASAVPAAPLEDPETSLRRTVQRDVAAMDHASAADQNRLVRRRPYWQKEYVEYPEDANNLRIDIQETESRTRPYIADVKLRKIRYATRLQRERTQAAADTSFLRHTGDETLTYEFRNGRWLRVGSLFVADSTEERVAGNWQPVEERSEEMVTQEPAKGFFNRTFSWITGRD